MSSIYVIMNEWTDDFQDFSEIVDFKYFLSENEAWVSLAIIAQSSGIILEGDETSFDVPEDRLVSLDRDTYFIQELTQP